MPPKKSFKKVRSSEQGNVRDQVKVQGVTHERNVYEKMGADGVMETHVEHTTVKKTYYGKPKDKYCGGCRTWIIKDYVFKSHGKACL